MELLSSRYVYDTNPHKLLNKLQLEMKQQVDDKVASGYYAFESVRCCVCGQRDFDLLSEKDRYGLWMSVKICQVCGLIQTNPRMTQAAYDEFYQIEYRKLYQGEDRPTNQIFYDAYLRGRNIYNYLQPWFSRPVNEYFVLEVGCGCGGVLQAFREQGCQVKGFDPGTEYLDFGRTNYGLDLVAGTLDDLVLHRSPDIIIYSHVFEHILDLHAELRTIKRALAKDGLLFIELPGVKNIENVYEGDFLLLLQNAHTYHFTLLTLTNLLQLHGFYCLAGNEVVFAIFSTDPSQTSREPTIQNDYSSVLSFLSNVESRYQVQQGLINYKNNRFFEAAEHFAEGVRLHPTNTQVRRLWAVTLMKMDRVDDAVKMWQTS
ncbi:MAG: class I SAM-dependent methyltransferase [Anaerolineae bacterium]|nr:class I SAM-dependent methyltransferase [Anaerolineae bacterium]